MKNQGDNMKLSELVNEVNTEQELLQLCDKLVADLLEEHLTQYPTLTDYSYFYKVSRKYIKIITNSGNQQSVWGFINRFEFQKGNTGITFKEGDVLKAAGWATPALNAPRGNLFDGYKIVGMRKYGPDYLI
tara:strand:- start:822 stop:1214 length:393 start_codon:yes stop_codon:yes gene_type:complete